MPDAEQDAANNGREAAVRILVRVRGRGESLTRAAAAVTSGLADGRDRALARELAYGVMRQGPRLEALLSLLLRRPLGRRDLDLQCLLLTGLYQLQETRIPSHAAVSETVAVAGRLGKPWARGLTNAVLRRFQRETRALAARVDADKATAMAFPAWLYARLARDWPGEASAIARASNARPPMTLRVNQRRTTRQAWRERLAATGSAAVEVPHCPQGLTLEKPMDVRSLPGFEAGLVSVQDGGAQLAAPLLAAGPGHRVLDLCAAPGGKTAHLLELGVAPSLIAVDIDGGRLARVGEGLARLGLAARLVEADGASPGQWWDGVPFDRILVDAPCSGTGVIRRHPDIKFLRRPGDIGALAARQRDLLEAAWRMLSPGGMLLYVTCSIIPEENGDQLDAFLMRHPQARARPIPAAWGRPLGAWRQVMPGTDNMDGFFFGRIERPASAGDER